MIPTGRARGVFKRRLLKWYDENRRDMPWRTSRDPYHILLSEFMLQQTQVQTVIPYFERFVRDFPSIVDLARADLDEILKRWEGLGYYTRARNLHKASRVITEDYGGEIPETYDELLSLPGFGPYTTAAVASIAFGKPYAVLDGNVIRVLTRMGAITEEASLPRTRAILQAAADDLLNTNRPGDHNQAMMELGATICKPKRPDCPTCPVSKYCQAFEQKLADTIPRKKKAGPRPQRTYGAVIVSKGDRVLISRRVPEGLLGGLWEFPSVECEAESAEATRRVVSESFGVETAVLRPFRRVTHTYTHFSAVVHAYLTEWVSGTPDSTAHDRHEWVGLDEIGDYAYSRIARKLVDALTERHTGDQMTMDLAQLKEPV